MITNKVITYYHQTLDEQTKLEKWTKYSFDKVWCFDGKAITQNDGIANNNNMQVRIEMKYVDDLSIFDVGDIVLVGIGDNINSPKDLQGLNFFKVTSVNINNFGGTPHIHLGGN